MPCASFNETWKKKSKPVRACVCDGRECVSFGQSRLLHAVAAETHNLKAFASAGGCKSSDVATRLDALQRRLVALRDKVVVNLLSFVSVRMFVRRGHTTVVDDRAFLFLATAASCKSTRGRLRFDASRATCVCGRSRSERLGRFSERVVFVVFVDDDQRRRRQQKRRRRRHERHKCEAAQSTCGRLSLTQRQC